MSAGQRPGNTSADAFMLMRYEGAGGRREWIWNSRDGITPFCVHSRDGVEMRHGNWHLDRYDPHHVPAIGARVFVDMTEEHARPLATERVNAGWDHPEYPMSARWSTREDAIEFFVRDWISAWGGHSPHVVEVTPALHEMFKARAAAAGDREQTK